MTSATPIRELTLTRSFDAPRELVFRMWTEARHIQRWWGPAGSDNPVCEIDARPGGKIFVHMRGPGFDHPMGGEFVELDPPKRLVFYTKAFEGEDGAWQLVNRNTVTFEESGGRTHVTLHVAVEHATPDMIGPLSGMEAGWSQSLDRLRDLIALSRNAP